MLASFEHVLVLTTLLLLLPLVNSLKRHSLPRSLISSHQALAGTSGGIYGEDNFGDIMEGGCETNVLVSNEFSNIERIIITANGNLQRIMSAYYGHPITVKVKKCDLTSMSENSYKYNREVDLLVDGKVFCNAVSNIEVFDESFKKLIESKQVGVGQLFRYFRILPRFQLIATGRRNSNILWREYNLSCPQMKCKFVETFEPHFLEFKQELRRS